MTFEAYRQSLLSKPLKGADCIVWLQADWRTLAGTLQVLQWAARGMPTVVILGNEERHIELRAPTPREMSSLLAESPSIREVVLRQQCGNTKEQAQSFSTLAEARGWTKAVGLTPHPHVPRAALTFGKWAPAIEMWWRYTAGTFSAELDACEQAKIAQYAAKGDCLRLEE
jgi:uncharacterized SAM-binding protein YcdF (DUF218 family)